MTEKVKKTLSPEQLEKLKVAREKALSVRQTNAKNKALEKELATAEKEQHLTEVKEKLAKVKAPKQEKAEVPNVVVIESEQDEPEPEVVVKKVKKVKKKIIVVEDSETDEEQQQVIYVKKVKAKSVSPPVEIVVPVSTPLPVKETIIDPYAKQYNSIFGRR